MKINFNNPNIDVSKTGRSVQKPAAGADFKSLLNDSLAGKTAANGPAQSMPPSMAIGSLLQVKAGVDAASVLDRIDTFLDVLDQYRSGLADPRVTLKQLYPLIQKIDTEKQHLSAMNDHLGEGDRLKGIIEDVLVTASQELAKFNRGEYV